MMFELSELTNTTFENIIAKSFDFASALASKNYTDPSLCSYAGFYQTPSYDNSYDKCQLAKNACSDNWDLVNFFYLHFCWFKGYYFLTLPLSLLFIYYIFVFTGAVVENYIAPAISSISEFCKMSESFAAVTLIALANGAGDVITAIVASGAPGGVAYNIGSLYGAGLFVISFVIAATIKQSKDDIEIDKSIIYRDVGFYILSTIVTLIFAIIGKITIISAIILLLIYGAMVVVVIVQDKIEAKRAKLEGQDEGLEQKILPIKDSEAQDQIQEDNKAKPISKWGNLKANLGTHMQKLSENDEHAKAYTALVKKRNLAHMVQEAFLTKLKMHREAKKLAEQDKEQVAWYKRIPEFIDMPGGFIRKITMPPCEKEDYDRRWLYACPIPMAFFLVWGFLKTLTWYYIVAAVVIGVVLEIVVILTQRGNASDNDLPTDKFWFIMSVVGAVGGLVWSYVVITILIDNLNTIIIILRLNKTFMGMTVLGIGNALPDSLTTIALAKSGQAIMGISGSYAGQLFGLLVGFGLAMLKTTLSQSTVSFDLFNRARLKYNMLDIWVVVATLITLVLTFIMGCYKKFRFGMPLAYILFTIYGIFFTGALGVQIYYLIAGIV